MFSDLFFWKNEDGTWKIFFDMWNTKLDPVQNVPTTAESFQEAPTQVPENKN